MTGYSGFWAKQGRAAACAVAAWAMSAAPAWALFGVGDIVSDPGSYQYYGEQIAQGLEQLEKLEEQVDRLDKIQEISGKVEGAMTGVYNRAKGVSDGIQKIKDFEKIPEEVAGIGYQVRDKFDKFQNLDEEFIDAAKELDNTFCDPRDCVVATSGPQRYAARQKAKKDVIVRVHRIEQQMEQRYQTVADLADQVDTTKNVKDAQDLTNRMLVELLRTLVDILGVMSDAAKAEGLNGYKGVNEETSKKIQESVAEAQQAIGKYDRPFKSAVKEAQKLNTGGLEGW